MHVIDSKVNKDKIMNKKSDIDENRSKEMIHQMRRKFLGAAGIGSIGVFLGTFLTLKKTVKYFNSKSRPPKTIIHPDAVKRRRKD
jgi:hypothetical protein